MDADETFRVGLIYGPSGCGKSSMLKAGLLPRLANHVSSVYIKRRYFGESDDLLVDYIWCKKNSEDRWMLPVGSL